MWCTRITWPVVSRRITATRGRRAGGFPAEGDVDGSAGEDEVDPRLLSWCAVDSESMVTAAVASVTEGWTSVPSMCRDVVGGNVGEDAVGSGLSAEGEVDGEGGEDGVDPSLLSSREADWKSTAAASAQSVTGVSMIVTRLRKITAAGADVVGGNGGEDVVGDSTEAVEGNLVGEEGVRRRAQPSWGSVSATVCCWPVARSWLVELGRGGNGDLHLQVGAVGEPSSVDLGVSGEVDGAAEELGDAGTAVPCAEDGWMWSDRTGRAGDGRAASEKVLAAAGRPLPLTQSFGAGL